MPSDTRFAATLQLLRAASSPFHAALVGAVDEVDTFLAAQRAPRERRVHREAAQLGDFGVDHIDCARFAELTATATALDGIRIGRLDQVHEVLTALLARGDDLYRVAVPPGADLRDTVRAALAARGRVFNAAQAFGLLRTGGALSQPVDEALDFRAWTKLHRTLAPPLIVEVAGVDLRAEGLGEYLDGGQKIVLLVDGPAAPAPLVRLVSPETFVLQTGTVEDLVQLRDFPGAGIAAVLPESCARFTHDPRLGSQLTQRLRVSYLPEPMSHAVAGGSLRQQMQDLAWLAELARIAATATAAPAAAPLTTDIEPAAKLAAWLLQQTDVTGA